MPELIPGTFDPGEITTVKKTNRKGELEIYFRCRPKWVTPDRKWAHKDMASKDRAKLISERDLLHTKVSKRGGDTTDAGGLHAYVDAWFAKYIATGTRKGKPYARNSVRKLLETQASIKRNFENLPLAAYDYQTLEAYHVKQGAGRQATLNTQALVKIFQQARKHRLIEVNPADGLEALGYETENPRDSIDPEDWRWIQRGYKTPKQKAACELLVMLGPRVNELLGLQRGDYNRHKGLMQFCRQVQRPQKGDTQADRLVNRLKTRAGAKKVFLQNITARFIKLSPGAIAVIEAYLAVMDAEGRTAPTELLFPSPEGFVWNDGNFRTRLWDRVKTNANRERKKAGLLPLRDPLVPHEARHTHISYRMQLGYMGTKGHQDTRIGEEVGQAGLAITMRYTHELNHDGDELDLLVELGKILGWHLTERDFPGRARRD